MSQFQPQQSQPVLIYPDSSVTTQPSNPHHSSNGSFGTVFIVLAVIIVVSATACFLSRLCSRRGGKTPKKQKQNHKVSHKERDVKFPPKLEREPKELGDIEFGFDKMSIARGKGVGNGGSKGCNKKAFENGDMKSKVKPSTTEDGEFYAGASHFRN